MDTTTRATFEQALRGEALAALKYWLFEDRAEAEGREEVAELFEAIGKQERREHAREIATLLGMPGSTRENLVSSIEGELDEHRRLYPGFASMARQAGDMRPPSRFQELGADEPAMLMRCAVSWTARIPRDLQPWPTRQLVPTPTFEIGSGSD